MLHGEAVATVADELLLTSLPDEVRAAIARVYGPVPEGACIYTEADMREAFGAGFDTACEQIESPNMYDSDFTYWFKARF